MATTTKIFFFLFFMQFTYLLFSQSLPLFPICGSDEISVGVIPSTGNVKALVIFVKFRNDEGIELDWHKHCSK
jgi:hypothetical protein